MQRYDKYYFSRDNQLVVKEVSAVHSVGNASLCNVHSLKFNVS